MSINTNLKDQIQQEKMPNGKKKTLLAAIELFSKNGFSATSTSQIAKIAGVSEATIFKYFKTKDQLLEALLKPTIKALVPEYQAKFIEKLASIKYNSIDELTTTVIFDRYEFIYENKQLLQILIEELLINDSLRTEVSELIKEQTTRYNDDLGKITKQIPDTNNQITTFDLFSQTLRLLFGYIIEQLVIHNKLPQKPTADLKILAKQLSISLRN